MKVGEFAKEFFVTSRDVQPEVKFHSITQREKVEAAATVALGAVVAVIGILALLGGSAAVGATLVTAGTLLSVGYVINLVSKHLKFKKEIENAILARTNEGAEPKRFDVDYVMVGFEMGTIQISNNYCAIYTAQEPPEGTDGKYVVNFHRHLPSEFFNNQTAPAAAAAAV